MTNVLVIGGSRGIGKSIVREFGYSNKYDVYCTSTTGENADYKLNLENNQNEIKLAIHEIIKDIKNVDILINNAGIIIRKDFLEFTDEDYNRIMYINIKGMFFVCQEIIPFMLKQEYGRIINISSVGGQIGGTQSVPYAISKAGVISLTRSLSNLYASKNILTNCIAPAIIETDMTIGDKTDITKIPIGRKGTPKDISKVCLMLAETEYITGQTIGVNGGLYLG